MGCKTRRGGRTRTRTGRGAGGDDNDHDDAKAAVATDKNPQEIINDLQEALDKVPPPKPPDLHD